MSEQDNDGRTELTCTWLIEGVQQTVPYGSHTPARLQESLLGGYIALQIAFMYAHHLMWNYLPALQRSYAPLSSRLLIVQ